MMGQQRPRMQFERWRMTGLEKGIVRVVPHHPTWQNVFERERRVLQEHIGGRVLDIQHAGSTAVPGLDAKPIIDIAVAIASPAVIAGCMQPLCNLDYIDRGDAGTEGGYLFVMENSPDVRTHHLHIVAIDNPQWRNYLRFRDILRADATVRTRYDELKKSLQEQFPRDRKAYMDGKTAFIRGVLSAS
jgi:GrpB-like predicted nucleotidyltransferase (UPF0157 family)